jgi:hypothetical protein
MRGSCVANHVRHERVYRHTPHTMGRGGRPCFQKLTMCSKRGSALFPNDDNTQKNKVGFSTQFLHLDRPSLTGAQNQHRQRANARRRQWPSSASECRHLESGASALLAHASSHWSTSKTQMFKNPPMRPIANCAVRCVTSLLFLHSPKHQLQIQQNYLQPASSPFC